jgi:hypothetical protein
MCISRVHGPSDLQNDDGHMAPRGWPSQDNGAPVQHTRLAMVSAVLNADTIATGLAVTGYLTLSSWRTVVPRTPF